MVKLFDLSILLNIKNNERNELMNKKYVKFHNYKIYHFLFYLQKTVIESDIVSISRKYVKILREEENCNVMEST